MCDCERDRCLFECNIPPLFIVVLKNDIHKIKTDFAN